MTSSRWLPRGSSVTPGKALLGVIGICFLLAVSSQVLRPSVDSSMVPPHGFLVGDAVAAELPQGGRIVVVSENCDVCLKRKTAYAQIASGDRSDIFIAVQTGENREIERALSAEALQSSRFVVLNQDELFRTLRVQAFPVSVTVDRDRRVTHAEVSRDGWLTGIGGPVAWTEAWKRLLFGQH